MAGTVVKVRVQNFGEEAVEVEVITGAPVSEAVLKAGYSVKGGEIRKDNRPVSPDEPLEKDSAVTLVPPMRGG